RRDLQQGPANDHGLADPGQRRSRAGARPVRRRAADWHLLARVPGGTAVQARARDRAHPQRLRRQHADPEHARADRLPDAAPCDHCRPRRTQHRRHAHQGTDSRTRNVQGGRNDTATGGRDGRVLGRGDRPRRRRARGPGGSRAAPLCPARHVRRARHQPAGQLPQRLRRLGDHRARPGRAGDRDGGGAASGRMGRQDASRVGPARRVTDVQGCLMEITNLGKADGLPPVDWAAIVGKLDAGSAPVPDALNSRTTWLSTINEDGSPHVTAVGALWLDGAFWFQTGAGTRKGRNVARDPRCSVAVSVRDADVVIEGDAVRVTEPGALARIARAWADQGWPAEPDGSGPGITAPFNAPAQGPPPWNVYRIEPRSAIVTLAAEPGGLTRFRF